MRKEFADFKNSLKSHADDMKRQQTEVNVKFDAVVTEIRKELAFNLKEIKDEVNNCNSLVKSNDIATKKRLHELEMLNHMIQHRLNRSDIIITGLSKDIDNLTDMIISLGSHLNVHISYKDIDNITQCTQVFDISPIFTTNDVSLQLSTLDSLINTLHDTVPVIRVKAGTTDNEWINSREIVTARNARDSAYEGFEGNMVNECLKELRAVEYGVDYVS
ncbi:hypothetical protein FF38_04465 [Lucilia cuprina]|uniref:Uncharacterized protein n=1 Tax=Lucilia cuprina TaxID=7375 RepID=A0A0L0CEX5_LUCCU|nr:hypothetical protein FF38_04465 [Lucilia cuprina]